MSGGKFSNLGYQNKVGIIHPIRVQPETLTLTLNGVANAAPTDPVAANVPSVKVGGSRKAIGVNARMVRVRTSETIPPTGYKPGSILSLPVLTQAAFDAYGKSQTGTYTLNGTAYDVSYVGKSPETIV